MAAKILTCRKFHELFAFSLLLLHISVAYGEKNSLLANSNKEREEFLPTVMVATLVRNKAYALPYFFGLLEKLDYPKDRMAIWLYSDHNVDNSTEVIKEWVAAMENQYNSIEFIYDDTKEGYRGEKSPCDWTLGRFQHVLTVREKALEAARLMWADYILMIDADVMIENPLMLRRLIEEKQTVIAPMMRSSVAESTYANFWGAVDENGFYKRIPEYFKVLDREFVGTFLVPMVHTVFLVDLRDKLSGNLTYLMPPDYGKSEDDIILFADSAKRAGVPMHVLNTEHFGQINIPLESYHNLMIEREQFMYALVETLDADNPEMAPGVDYIIEGRGLIPSPHISMRSEAKDRLGFDKVYMVNLERRSERRTRMMHVFDVLGIEAEWVPAVDGKLLNDTYLYKDLKIEVVPGFSDPYGGRPMTMGEIGCFLSHYFIWKDMLEKGYKDVVVFEDDLRFEPYFRSKLNHIMKLVKHTVPDWDLIYLGRKRLNRKDERFVEGTDNIVWPSYSYWTLSYLLSAQGAKKLLAQMPLQNLLPVDEYLPVMFDQHPEKSWKEPFHPRDLVALSAEPLLIYPTHYLGEANYISDTEFSELIIDKTDHNRAEVPQSAPESDLNPKENLTPGADITQKGPEGMESMKHIQDEL
ncbi:glycosyltransferase 25 family member-like isoform X2 [Mya arenaria]|uniref:glycosyltransferase 25 family member-like isoform X2 n=1 Tax=Mya arenaria TaxID=6604 RepID=UPI0022E58959|nr:glycosyltransferase 25 family member-like isoform X2 [Mya arenaria]